jgi:hypothetical protein
MQTTQTCILVFFGGLGVGFVIGAYLGRWVVEQHFMSKRSPLSPPEDTSKQP